MGIFKWRPIKYNPRKEMPIIELHKPKPRPHKFILYEQLLRDAEKYHNEQDCEVSQQILQILKTKLENDN